jgi:hypothetical protein
MEVSERKLEGQKRYTCDIDMNGHPFGHGRITWLTCLQGHSNELDFSINDYNVHNTKILLNVKARVDNTFEYRGGIGRVIEEAFHAILKKQLKMKRYQMKKRMVEGLPRPLHICADHWLSLSNLIADENKQKQAKQLKQNRARVKKVSMAGRSEGEVRTNLVHLSI